LLGINVPAARKLFKITTHQAIPQGPVEKQNKLKSVAPSVNEKTLACLILTKGRTRKKGEEGKKSVDT